MKILVTGAKGFVGKNLCAQLNNIKEGRAKCYGDLNISEVFEYDIDSTAEELDFYCKEANFVFHLAGVNRPQNQGEFMKGNFGFTSVLLNMLKKHKNYSHIMISSSIQATLAGRFGVSEYGKSKKAGEELMFEYEKETGAKVFVYRFPNLFGKWCKPNYNSVVATFCHNTVNSLPIHINDKNTEMELLYIDDLVDEMILLLKGKAHKCIYDGLNVIPDENGQYCYCPITHRITVGEIADLVIGFSKQLNTSLIPDMPENSFEKKLYSTYLSYLPKEKASFPLKMNIDERGSFTELLHTLSCGQVSINISKPGITKGEHWHNTKWELFIVVSGHGLIRQRRIDSGEILDYEVSGDKIEAVCMLPGYTHNIINLSETENLVTVMYCNEIFNPNKPDTYFLPVNI